MENNAFGLPLPRRPTRLETLGIPILMPFVFFFIDRYCLPGAFTFPLMLLALLCYLAFRLPAWAVACWIVIYATMALMVSLREIQTPSLAMLYLRTSSFLIAGTAAALLVSHRGRLENSPRAFFSAISVLKLAVIVSDISGNILLLNREAQKVLEGRLNDLSGLSYFSTFVSPDKQGRAIAKYISYFNLNHSGRVATDLHMRGEPPLILRATITVVGPDQNRYAVTMVQKVEEVLSHQRP